MAGSKVISSFVLISITFSGIAAHARTFRIFEVRKNLQLTESEPIIHDYYLNAGSAQGLHAGMTIPVTRKEAVHDFYGDSEDDLVVSVGRLRLISVQPNLSVGRMIVVDTARKLAAAPVLDFETIMIGDGVDLAGARGSASGNGNGDGNGDSGDGKNGNGDSGDGKNGDGLGAVASASAPETATAQAPTLAIPKTAPKITMEPMGPAPKPEPKRAVATATKESGPKLELHSPEEFKNLTPESGSLDPDESAPEVNAR